MPEREGAEGGGQPPGTGDRLEAYRAKRRFARTPEPPGDGGDPAQGGGRFVVQEHHATRLHWDLRLEREGALASWAVPNGIPDDPRRNRKAVRTEDHPLEYLEFAGTIPRGSYGAGEMSIWDRGEYRCEKWEPGKVVVELQGERVRGRYALFHTGPDARDWMIHRMDPPADPTAAEMPDAIEPMLARLSTLPADQDRWSFEVKWDGVRALAHSQPGRLRLVTRNRRDVIDAYPELRPLNRALGSHSAILDGEIVAFDQEGRPSFEALQGRIHLRGEAAVRRRAEAAPVVYVIFDLLWLDGHPLLDRPYAERRARLEGLGLEDERFRTPAHHPGAGGALLAATRERGLEGVVAKRLDSRYEPGRRSGAWLKIKNHLRQEVVIGGWTSGRGRRAQRLGALEVGVHGEEGLVYAGRVGTGFDDAELERLGSLLAPLEREGSPFAGRQPAGRTHYVEPRLVCDVEFTEWTRQGMLRHPSYKGLRDDRDADEVRREEVAPPPEPPSAVAGMLAAGRPVRSGVEVEVQGRTLRLSNPDKVLYPATGFTKGDLIDYLVAVAPVLLPHLRARPLTLKRYPDGVEGEHFYEKQCPRHRPEWVATTAVWSGRNRREIEFCLVEELPTLVWLGNLADLELHPSLSCAPDIGRPTAMAFDLDPGAPASIVECCEVALRIRDLLGQLGLRAYAKTSGSKGLQVYVPLNRDDVTYDDTKPFAHAVADLLERRHPALVVSRMAKELRRGRVLVDWSQNDQHKTTVCVYSLRAMERPMVSTPVDWDEVSACRDAGEPGLLAFDHAQALDRVARRGDLFAPVLELRQELPRLAGETGRAGP